MSTAKEQQLADIARDFLDDCKGLYEHTEDFLDAVNGYVNDMRELDSKSQYARILKESMQNVRSAGFLLSGNLSRASVNARNIFNSKE